jgi:hypothetical protein
MGRTDTGAGGMKKIYTQKVRNQYIKLGMVPVSFEDEQGLESFKDNQILKNHTYGSKKPRSVLQNKWVHAMFRVVAQNTDNPDWNTPEKVKRQVKLKMKFFKDDVIVHGNKVYFELRSFAFDEMEHNEANVRYEDAKNICAKFLGVRPEVLEAQAQKE